MSTQPSHWRRQAEHQIGNSALFLLAHLAHLVPRNAALALGRSLGRLTPRLSPRHYHRVLAEISAAFPTANAEDIARLAYMSLGENLIEFLRLPSMSNEAILSQARIEGREHVDTALAHGKGVVMFTGHLGNWELCGTVMGLSGYPLTAIAREQLDSALTDLFLRIRESHGLTIVPMSDVRGCLRVLKRNGCLAVLCDVNANIPGAFVQFFGRPAATYTGVAYFALATGATILPVFDERLPDKTHVCRVLPPIQVEQTGDRNHDLLITTIRVQRSIEAEIRRRPQDWFWLLQRWKTRPEDVPFPERVPMEHRDLSAEEVAVALGGDSRVVNSKQ